MTAKSHSPGFLKLVEDAKTRIREIQIPEVLKKLERKEAFRFIDVREDNEWAQGHCPEARHMGRGQSSRHPLLTENVAYLDTHDNHVELISK